MAALSLPPPNSHLPLEMPGGAPRFLCFPRSVAAPVGSHAVMRCRISGDPPPCVLWERVGNIRLELGDRCLVQQDGDWYQLVISDLRLEDSGHYMCRASNWSGEGYAGAKLTVTHSLHEDPHTLAPSTKIQGPSTTTSNVTPRSNSMASSNSQELCSDANYLLSSKADYSEIPDFPPHFLLVPTSQRLCRGQSAELTCRLSGKPEPTVRWEKDGTNLEDICDGSHYRLSPGGHTLNISYAHAPDAGVYVCRASNTVGQCLAAAVLLVDPTPRQGQEPAPGDPPPQVKVFTVNEGKHAKLRCLVTGKPRPEIIWRKDGRAVSPGRRTLIYEDREGHFILKVLFCRQQDRGLYVCGASNTAGNTLSAVMLHVREVGERFPAPLRDIAVREGQDAVLECSVPDGSRTSWFLEDQRLHPGKRHHMEEQGPIRRLIIRGARTDDDGVYVCQTQRGAQTIAEVAVRGSIVKRLPRRLEVIEGGNAAFCAETDSDVEQVGWTQHGEILSEDSSTVLKSFGRTHVLVLVGVRQEDSGIIQFHAGLSESSCQLRVKARGVNIAPACGEAPSRTLEAGEPISLNCHVPSSGTKVRWMKDGQELESRGRVSIKSDGRMRRLLIAASSSSDSGTYTCHAANDKTGFSVTVTEAPAKFVNTSDNTEQGCLSGESMVLSCEVSRESAEVRWHRDGVEVLESDNIKLESDGRYRRLIIRSVRPRDAGTFVCNAGDDAVVYNVRVTEPPVKIVNPSDDTEHTCVSGESVELSCEVSRETAPVRWYRDGVEVQESEGVRLETEGKHRRLIIDAAKAQDSGEYVCDTGDDSVFYSVIVTEPPVKIVNANDDTELMSLSGERVVLSCELSRENVPVNWYKDGEEVVDGIILESDGRHRRLIIPSAQSHDSGEYVCDAGDDSVFYNVTVTDPPVKIVNTGDDAEHAALSGERVVLSCEVSQENAQVRWYRDGVEVEESESIRLEADGKHRRLVIDPAQAQDSGEFVCDAGDDSVFYNVTVTDPAVKLTNTSDDTELMCVSGGSIVLSCKVSRDNAQVRWYRDGVEVEDSENISRLIIDPAAPELSGEFVCDARDDSVSYTVIVTEPPVKILNASDDNEERCLAGDQVVLSCEVSRENAAVRWYKDGERLEESGRVLLESDGRVRRLVILTSQTQDSGEYVCDAGDDSIFYNMTVAEPPVKIVNTGDDGDHSCHSGGRIVLGCELSRENAPVTWYKDGVEVEERDDLIMESEGKYRRLIIPVAQTRDSGEFVCDAGDDSVFYNVTVTEPPVKLVNTCDGPEHTCVSGESVVLSCEVSRGNALVQWFRNGVEVEESDRIRLESDGTLRRLIIDTAEIEDMGEFECDAGDDSLLYYLTVAEPPVKFLNVCDDLELHFLSGDRGVLSCEVSRETAPVRWYRDGVEVKDGDGVVLKSEGAQRRLIIPAVQTQDTGEFICDAGDDKVFFSVIVTEPPTKILFPENHCQELEFITGDRVELVIELSRCNGAVRWFKDGLEVDENDNLQVRSDRFRRWLVLPKVKVEDSGEYICDTDNDSVTFDIKVSEPPVTIISSSCSPAVLHVTEGDPLSIECELSRSTSAVRWLKEGKRVIPNDSLTLEEQGTKHFLRFLSAQPEHAGHYECNVGTDSRIFTVHVDEAVVEILGREQILPRRLCTVSEDLRLALSLSRSDAEVRWYKDGERLRDNPHMLVEERGAERSLTILGVTRGDAGEYLCDARHDNFSFYVTVGAPPVVIVGNTGTPENHTLMAGDDLVLSCELSRPNFKVRWLRDGEELVSAGRVKILARGVHRQLTIQSLRPSDSGTYTCDATTDQLHTTVHVEVPRQVEFITEVQNLTVLEGETATFKCVASPDDVSVLWELNGSSVHSDKRAAIYSNGLCHSFTLNQCRLSDSGTITANAEGLISRARLRVQEAQVLFTQGLQDTEVEEEQDVTLRVKVTTEKAEIHWVKQGVVIQPSSKFTLHASERMHSLTIHSVQPCDRGRYSCESLHDRTDCRLSVLPRSIAVKKGLEDVKCVEGGNVEFSVELSHDALVGEWWKGGVRLASDDHCMITASGRCHFLRFFNLALPDSGIIAFTSDVLRTTAQLTVTEHPLAITQAPQDSVVNEAGSAAFQCEVSKQEAVVTWSKDGVQLTPNASCRMYSVGHRRILQLSNCGLQDAGTYSCHVDARTFSCHVDEISASATLRVLEQEPEVVKDLQNVDIVENENAVFVCELSCAQAVGEWFRNEEKIKVTTTTKIRQEGKKHFLLICGARCEDEGEIIFRSRRIESRAQLRVAELPVRIVKALRDKTALDGHRVVLECKVSPPRAQVTWLKGNQEIVPSSKYQICTEDAFRKLIISNVNPDDEDMYTAKTKGVQSSARLLVEGLAIQLFRSLTDVKVKAPGAACFECEVSVALSRPPQWSLNGAMLHSGPDVILENRGTRYKLLLQRTDPSMSGVVRFTAGKTRSEAKLTVRE
ncbi:LOW QUALITY PROTEIN: obscurin-like protein 1 [Pelodytes ibericus]